MNYGEIMSLDRHRLMCGDATKREDVEKLIAGEKVDLVLTDPLYGMKVQDKNGAIGNSKVHRAKLRVFVLLKSRQYPLLIGDNSQEVARKHYEIIKDVTDKIIMWGGQYFAHFLPISGAWIFWNKRTGNNDFSDGELAWVSKGRKVKYYEHLWNGVCMAGSYALNARGIGKGGRARIHPTQKPA